MIFDLRREVPKSSLRELVPELVGVAGFYGESAWEMAGVARFKLVYWWGAWLKWW